MERERMRVLIQSLVKVYTSFRLLIQQNMGIIDEDITLEMLHVLIALWRKDGINQQELADRIFKDKSSLSYLLTNLEKRNLIERLTDPLDRRNKLIKLTTKGFDLKAKYAPFIDGILDDLVLKMSPDEVKEYIDQLVSLDGIITEIAKERAEDKSISK